ncbi:MAG: hypothetical protein ACXWUM_10335 [Burkholderiaceae bacterium]
MFVGGPDFQLPTGTGNVSGIAWFPLGPRDIYQPAYPVSRRYYEDINRSNTVVGNTVIKNTYNNLDVTKVVYANQRIPRAVVSVPAASFAQSQPVSRAAIRVPQELLANAPVTSVPTTAPTARSVRGNATQRHRPPASVLERPVVARTAPPPAPVGFAARQAQLTAKPGKPPHEATRKELRTVAVAPAVKVIEANTAPSTRRPPPAKAGPKAKAGPRQAAEPRGRSDDRKVFAVATVAAPEVASSGNQGLASKSADMKKDKYEPKAAEDPKP